jgi:hypothetical protein
MQPYFDPSRKMTSKKMEDDLKKKMKNEDDLQKKTKNNFFLKLERQPKNNGRQPQTK